MKIPKLVVAHQMLRDLNVMASLPHQNILVVHGITNSSPPRIVCEQMDMDLDHAIHTEKYVNSRQLALRICRDIASGLAHLHYNNVFHRDAKPKNVVIRRK